MDNQIKPSVTNPTIADIYQLIDQGQLILRPAFQRNFVWTHKHQEDFIDTILKGLPFPEIYVCEGEVDIQRMHTIRNVIDGQQRLTTIHNYIKGKHDKPLNKISTYQALIDIQKKDFLSYQLVVRNIGRVDEEVMREVFRRINLTEFKLDDVEVRNAIYDGEFIQTAKNILENIQLKKYEVFTESNLTRMADLHFILLVLTTIEQGGYFYSDKDVESVIADFNDEYPHKNHMIALMIKVFARINDLDLPLDSMWFRKANFFTLVVEIAKNIERIPDNFKEKLLVFEENVMEGKRNSESPYARYYKYMYQATHGRTARVVRSEYFEKECL